MQPFTTSSGLVVPIDRPNVDTDAIIPKQFLKSIKRSGFGPNLFDEWRYLDKGEPDKGDRKDRAMAKKGENPGGVAVRTRYVSGRVEAIDTSNRYIAIRGPNQQTLALKAAPELKLEALQPGDRITIAYTQALAAEMVPQSPKQKPAAKKKS